MSNHETRATFHERIHGTLDVLFGTRVHRACCFIQNQNVTIRQNCSRNSQKLSLTLADVACVLVDHKVVPTGKCLNEVMRAARLCRSFHLFIACVKAPITNVVANRAVEQPRILQNHAETRTNIGAAEFTHITPIDTNSAIVDVVETHEQFDQRRLARARWSHQRNHLTFLHNRREVVDNDLI